MIAIQFKDEIKVVEEWVLNLQRETYNLGLEILNDKDNPIKIEQLKRNITRLRQANWTLEDMAEIWK